jgi:hypothetical protein
MIITIPATGISNNQTVSVVVLCNDFMIRFRVWYRCREIDFSGAGIPRAPPHARQHNILWVPTSSSVKIILGSAYHIPTSNATAATYTVVRVYYIHGQRRYVGIHNRSRARNDLSDCQYFNNNMYVNRTSSKRALRVPIIGLVLNGEHRKRSSESIYIYICFSSDYKYMYKLSIYRVRDLGQRVH